MSRGERDVFQLPQPCHEEPTPACPRATHGRPGVPEVAGSKRAVQYLVAKQSFIPCPSLSIQIYLIFHLFPLDFHRFSIVFYMFFLCFHWMSTRSPSGHRPCPLGPSASSSEGLAGAPPGRSQANQQGSGSSTADASRCSRAETTS